MRLFRREKVIAKSDNLIDLFIKESGIILPLVSFESVNMGTMGIMGQYFFTDNIRNTLSLFVRTEPHDPFLNAQMIVNIGYSTPLYKGSITELAHILRSSEEFRGVITSP